MLHASCPTIATWHCYPAIIRIIESTTGFTLRTSGACAIQWNATAKFMDISKQWTTKLSPSLQLAIVASFHKYTMPRPFNYTGTLCCIQNSAKIKHYFCTFGNTNDYESLRSMVEVSYILLDARTDLIDRLRISAIMLLRVLFGMQNPLSPTAFRN